MKVEDIRSVLERAGMPFSFTGDPETSVDGFTSIYHYRAGTLSWLRKVEMLESDDCVWKGDYAAVITPLDGAEVPRCKAQFRTEDPRKAFFLAIDTLWGEERPVGISPIAVVEEGAVIGEDVFIGANCCISAQTTIGPRCYIGTNVTLRGRVSIGHDCVIQSGAVIGEDGFAFIKGAGTLTFVPHYGGVKIGNHVSIGANACICRGTIDDTTLCDHAKIDNLCHIAHNTVIGERTQVIAGAVIMGSSHIGHDCWISTATLRDQCHVGDFVTVGMGAVVVKNVDSGVTVLGSPARQMGEKG
jgi:UDP-3-O-[3-hydroxymyristoyl] glucosamine N-acyltransferase